MQKHDDPTRALTLADLSSFRTEMQRGFADIVTEILGKMVTKVEFEERMNQMVTKAEFEERMNQMVTKAEFEEQINQVKYDVHEIREDLDEVKKDLAKVKKSMVTKTDLVEMVGELKASREELAVTSHQYHCSSDRLDNHEERITKLELVLG